MTIQKIQFCADADVIFLKKTYHLQLTKTMNIQVGGPLWMGDRNEKR